MVGFERVLEVFYSAEMALFRYNNFFNKKKANMITPFDYAKYMPTKLSLLDIKVKNNFLMNFDSIITILFCLLLVYFILSLTSDCNKNYS